MFKSFLIRSKWSKIAIFLIFSFNSALTVLPATRTLSSLTSRLQKRSALNKKFRSAKRVYNPGKKYTRSHSLTNNISSLKRTPSRNYTKLGSDKKEEKSGDNTFKKVNTVRRKSSDSDTLRRTTRSKISSSQDKDDQQDNIEFLGNKDNNVHNPLYGYLSKLKELQKNVKDSENDSYEHLLNSSFNSEERERSSRFSRGPESEADADENDSPGQANTTDATSTETRNVLAETFGYGAVSLFLYNNDQETIDGYEALVEEMGPSFKEFVEEFGELVGFEESQDFESAFWSCGWGLLEALEDVNESGFDAVSDDLEMLTDMYGEDKMDSFINSNADAFAITVEKNCTEGDFADLIGDLSEKYGEQEVDDLFQEFGFAGINQFLTEDLGLIAENRLTSEDDGRPLAVMIYGGDSLAFSYDDKEIHEMIEKGFNVMYYNAKTDVEVINGLRDATHDGENKASAIILGGHGDFDYIYLSGQDEDSSYLDFDDHDKLKNFDVSLMLEEGGSVVLNCCCTGSGRENYENMANFMADVFDTAGYVHAPEDEVSAMDFEYEGDRIVDVTWYENLDEVDGELVGVDPVENYNAASQYDTQGQDDTSDQTRSLSEETIEPETSEYRRNWLDQLRRY